MREKGHCLVVVAEGAEEGLISEKRISKEEKRDGSGNLIYDDIGTYLEKHIYEYAKSKHEMECFVSAIDPTYAIRSVPANAGDTQLCSQLSQHAVHGVMHGFTGFTTGSIRNSMCYIPVTTMMTAGTRKVLIRARIWQRLLAMNNQPEFLNEQNKEVGFQKILAAEKLQFDCI